MAGVPQPSIALPVDVPASTPQPMRSAAAFGADIGSGLEQLGGQLQQDQVRAKDLAAKRQYEVDASAAGVTGAQARLDASQQIDAIRGEAAPGAAGHVEAVTKAVDDIGNQFLSTIRNPVLRQQYGEDWARYRAQQIGEESSWAAGAKVVYQVSNVKQTANLLANNVLSRPDAGTFDDAMHTLATTIGNQGLPADKAEQLLREQAASLAEARARGAAMTDPAGALKLLGGDELTPWLPSDKRAELIGFAQTQLRIEDADARRQIAQQAALVRTDASALSAKIAQGVLVPDDELAGIAGRAQALAAADPGLANVVDGLRYDQGKLKYSRLTDKWTSTEWEQNVNALAAKVASGKASDDDQRELKILQELRGPKEQRFNSDPDGFSSASGIPAPQVDLANPDPSAIAERKRWAQSFAHTGGLVEPPYLNKNQLADYRQRVAQSPAAELDVAGEIKSEWGMDAAPSIVRQIGGAAAPDMKIMLGLDPAIAQRFRRGQEALDKKAVELNDDAARTAWAGYARGVPGDVQPALFDAARKIAAGWMLEKGFSKPPANSDEVFQAALQYAAGRTGDVRDFNAPGGLAQLNGRFAWLPSDMTSNDFLRRIARAQPQDWVHAATDARGNPVASVPHYMGPDGKPRPYTKSDALRFGKGTLQSLDAGLYHLIDPMGHVVVDERGSPWTFDVRRLPR